MNDDLLVVRSPGVNFHVLRDGDDLYAIDAGFIGSLVVYRKELRARGWEQLPLRGIIVTHGHLDHILNVGRLARETGAWIAAPRLDAAHYQGVPSYSRWAHVTGVLESVGRPLLGFRRFVPDVLFDDGHFFPHWGGLRVVHLPGHTWGHSALYVESRNLLFSADLFSSNERFSFLPPAIFNHDGALMRESARRVLDLPVEQVLPNHGDAACPGLHRERMLRLLEAESIAG